MKHVARRQPSTEPEARRRFVPLAQQEGVILETAGRLFLERGYDGVSIDAITAIVGGSKRNLYDLFGSKVALFRAVVAHLAKARVDLVRNISVEGDLHDALAAMGVQILGVLLAPETLALHRLMIAEAGRVPESAATFLNNGPLAAYEAVEDLLHAQGERRGTPIAEPDVSARMFVDALAAGLLLRALLGQTVEPAEIDLKAKRVVRRLF